MGNLVKKSVILFIGFSYLYGVEQYYWKHNQKIVLTPIEQSIKILRAANSSNIKYYKTPNNQTVGVNDEIIIKLKNTDDLDKVITLYNLSLIEQISLQTYLLKSNNTKTLEILDQIHSDDLVEYAHPNFIRKIQKR